MSKNHERACAELGRQLAAAQKVIDRGWDGQPHYRALSNLHVIGAILRHLEAEQSDAVLLRVERLATDEALRRAAGTSIRSDAIEQLREDEDGKAWAKAAMTLRGYAPHIEEGE